MGQKDTSKQTGVIKNPIFLYTLALQANKGTMANCNGHTPLDLREVKPKKKEKKKKRNTNNSQVEVIISSISLAERLIQK